MAQLFVSHERGLVEGIEEEHLPIEASELFAFFSVPTTKTRGLGESPFGFACLPSSVQIDSGISFPQ